MLKKIAAGVGALIALGVVLFLIKVPNTVERSITVNASPETIHPFVASPKRWQEWSAWTNKDHPDMTYTYEGPEQGVGAISKWSEKSDAGSMVFTSSQADQGIAFDLEFGNGRMKSKGTIAYEPSGAATKVVWRMTGDVPLLMKPMMNSMIGPDLEKGLANLKRVAEAASP